MSDRDDYATHVAAERQAENRVFMHVDAAGYAVMTGGWYGMVFLRADDASLEFLSFMRACRDRYPLPPEDVAWPDGGWPVDEDGRALSVLEVTRQHHLTHTEKAAS